MGIERVGTVSLFVEDQDRAKLFYTQKLGMEVRADQPMTPTSDRRWVAVAPKGAKTEIILYVPDENWEHYRQVVGMSQALTLEVKDMSGVFRHLKSKGVKFIQIPTLENYGTYAIIEDSEGNKIILVEPVGHAPS